MQNLRDRLLEDVNSIGMPSDFRLKLKMYSKRHYGIYNPNTEIITLYIFEDAECTRLVPYEELLMTLMHELVHHLQWSDLNFNRIKGIMHDEEFKKLFNMYSNRIKAKLLLKEVIRSANAEKTKREAIYNSPLLYQFG